MNWLQCNFGLKSYLWLQIELTLRIRSILKSRVWFLTNLHSTQFNYHYVATQSSFKFMKTCIIMQHPEFSLSNAVSVLYQVLHPCNSEKNAKQFFHCSNGLAITKFQAFSRSTGKLSVFPSFSGSWNKISIFQEFSRNSRCSEHLC